MKKILFLVVGLFLCHTAYGAVPNIFANDTVADAILVNENFDYFEIKFSTTGGHDHDASDSKAITILNTLVTVGTIGTGEWQGTIVDTVYGGTGQGAFTTGDLIQATADNVLGKISPGTAGKFLQSQGASVEVSYQKVDLADTADVTGVLAITNGGTGGTDGTGGNAGGDLTGTYPNPTLNAQPAFMARVDQHDDIGVAEETVQFTEVFDTGSDFASSTFTAPADGNYLLNWNITFTNVDVDATLIRVQIQISGTSAADFNYDINPALDLAGDGIQTLGTSVIANMTSGDTAIITYTQTGGADQVDITDDAGWFSGFALF